MKCYRIGGVSRQNCVCTEDNSSVAIHAEQLSSVLERTSICISIAFYKRIATTHLHLRCMLVAIRLYLFAVRVYVFVSPLHFTCSLCYDIKNCAIYSMYGVAVRLQFFVFRDCIFAFLGHGVLHIVCKMQWKCK